MKIFSFYFFFVFMIIQRVNGSAYVNLNQLRNMGFLYYADYLKYRFNITYYAVGEYISTSFIRSSCVQYLSVGFLASDDCNLPKSCGNTLNHTMSSSLFSSHKFCFGIDFCSSNFFSNTCKDIYQIININYNTSFRMFNDVFEFDNDHDMSFWLLKNLVNEGYYYLTAYCYNNFFRSSTTDFSDVIFPSRLLHSIKIHSKSVCFMDFANQHCKPYFLTNEINDVVYFLPLNLRFKNDLLITHKALKSKMIKHLATNSDFYFRNNVTEDGIIYGHVAESFKAKFNCVKITNVSFSFSKVFVDVLNYIYIFVFDLIADLFEIFLSSLSFMLISPYIEIFFSFLVLYVYFNKFVLSLLYSFFLLVVVLLLDLY